MGTNGGCAVGAAVGWCSGIFNTKLAKITKGDTLAWGGGGGLDVLCAVFFVIL
jgi:hypothetical protein